jgi:sugar O-acyltransferase (sialic acid O-acetyltransferase NeuD family)
MRYVVLFGIGSPLVVDFEETCRRGTIGIVAGIRNVDGPVYVSAEVPVLTPAQVAYEIRQTPPAFPMFTPGHRLSAREGATTLGLGCGMTIVDPTAIVASSSRLGEGAYINAGCIIGGAVRIGNYVLLNRAASVGHHLEIGDFCSIGPGATVAGQVQIGKGTVVGAGAVILPEIVIGTNAIIAAGSVVTHSVPDRCLVAGNPARRRRTDIEGYNGRRV